jgi:hypothetical protein
MKYDELFGEKKYVMMFVMAVLLLYTAVHFLYSGIYMPFFKLGGSTFFDQYAHLTAHLSTGKPLVTPPGELIRGYGPVFFFLCYPLAYFSSNGSTISTILAFVNLTLGLAIFVMLYRTLFDQPRKTTALLFFTIVYFNFAPMMEIIAERNCEMWEYALIMFSMILIMRDDGRGWNRWNVGAGVCIGLASMIKLLPLIFVFYLLLRNFRAFASSIITIILVMLASEAVFAGDVGFQYFSTVFIKAAGGDNYVRGDWENISLLGLLDKLRNVYKIKWFTTSMSTLTHKVILVASMLISGYYVYRYRNTKEKTVMEYAVFSIFTMLLSPHSALDYAVLTLPFYCVFFALFFNGKINVTIFDGAALVISYLMVGLFLPMTFYGKYLPWNFMDKLFDYTGVHYEGCLGQSFKTYGVPTFGMIIAVLLAAKIIKQNGSFWDKT